LGDAVLVDWVFAACVLDANQCNRRGSLVELRVRANVAPGASKADLLIARKASLKALIDEQLIQADADRMKLEVTDEEVETAIQAVSKNYQLSAAALDAELKRQGFTIATYRKEIRRQLLELKWLMTKMGGRTPTPAPTPEPDRAKERARFLAALATEFDVEVR
jgi:SurA N-terminal domain